MIEATSGPKTNLNLQGEFQGEIGICIVKGYIEACGTRVEAGKMLVSKEEDACNLTVGENTHLLFFGGQPFPEERHIYWNFVATSKEKIEAAKQRWVDKEFEMVSWRNWVYSFTWLLE